MSSPPKDRKTHGKASPRRPGHGARRRGRELTLKYLYAADIAGHMWVESFESFAKHQEEKGSAVVFARGLVAGVMKQQDLLDDILREIASNWSLDRMAFMDRNVLRLASFELLRHSETPFRVVINEAVELAKKFGTKDSGRFVNGILDRIRKARDSGKITLPQVETPGPKGEGF